jgi:hypothetical protein
MALEDELGAVVEAAGVFAEPGEKLGGILASEPADGLRVYLCAYARADELTWLAFDARGEPILDRALVRDAVSMIALCELAEDSAGGGDLPTLRARLAELRATEAPEGIEEAEEAAAALQATIVDGVRLASAEYLDAIGAAAMRLERALGEVGPSPFAAAMQSGAGVVDELARDVERRYKGRLG